MCVQRLLRQFVENPPNKRIPQQLWDMVDKFLLEKIPIAGISRVTEISEPWLQQYINQKYEHVPQQIDISKRWCLTCSGTLWWTFFFFDGIIIRPLRIKHYPQKKGGLTVECDEMWSFVGLKRNKQWILGSGNF